MAGEDRGLHRFQEPYPPHHPVPAPLFAPATAAVCTAEAPWKSGPAPLPPHRVL